MIALYYDLYKKWSLMKAIQNILFLISKCRTYTYTYMCAQIENTKDENDICTIYMVLCFFSFIV